MEKKALTPEECPPKYNGGLINNVKSCFKEVNLLREENEKLTKELELLRSSHKEEMERLVKVLRKESIIRPGGASCTTDSLRQEYSNGVRFAINLLKTYIK